ncbi:MAG: phenylalanine--tRNA ligase subunit beta, partial [Candidatus Parcubacteria bacterium]
MKISYLWLQTYFSEPLPAPEEFADTLTFGAFEIESVDSVGNDTVIDVKVLPNRAHDCLSHRGIAREYASLSGRTLKKDPLSAPMPVFTPQSASVAVKIYDSERCQQYCAARLDGVRVQPSPAWLKERLEALGQRSINNLVDATNYVMMDLGTPLHVFDANTFKLKENKINIGVRAAQDGEKATILGGKEYTLTPLVTVITDDASQEVVALGGVKGGAIREVTYKTSSIIIEAARFHPSITRKAAQSVGIRTDASKRYENMFAESLPRYGLAAVVALILEIAGGTVEGYAEDGIVTQEMKPVSVTTERINAVLGFSLRTEDIAALFAKQSFTFTQSGSTFIVTPPFERLDIDIEEDLIEEVGRLHGYDKLPTVPLQKSSESFFPESLWNAKDVVRRALNELGFVEVLTYSLQNTGEVALLNSLAADKGFLRQNLADDMKRSLKVNESHAGYYGEYDTVKIFEIGNVFKKEGEFVHVCIGVHPLSMKKRSERTNALLLLAKDAIQKALGNVSVDHRVDENTLEFPLTPEIVAKAPALDALPLAAPEIRYQPLSAYPFVLRDIALWTPEGTAAEIVREHIKKEAGALCIRCDQFDTFTKEGKTSYAFHLVYQSFEKTLTDEEVNEIMKRIENSL